MRFKPTQPLPIEEPETIHDVSKESTVRCIQNGNPGAGQEDCLLLNVYVPKEVIEDPEFTVPVMVFLHGGAYATGSGRYSDYGPQHFMKHGIILVTINYRLGPFGFLTLGTDDVPGNAAIHDQIMALKWVRDNVQSFGGDPNSVTVFGQSAGSFSVSMLLLSPLAKGLFQRAIMQSGTPINPSWRALTHNQGIKYGQIFLEKMGCGQSEEGLECLQKRDAKDIDAKSLELTALSAWAPSPDSLSSKPLLPDDPEVLLSTGHFNTDVQVIVGTTKDEGVMWFYGQLLDPSSWATYKDSFDTVGIKQLLFLYGMDPTTEDLDKAHKILDFYVGDIENIDEDHRQGLFNMGNDANELYGTHKTVDYLVNQGMEVYQYLLTYRGEHSISAALAGIQDDVGVNHGDELFYQFDPFIKLEYGWDRNLNATEDLLVRETLLMAWTNFAKHGDPTPPGSCLPTWTPQPQDSEEQVYWNIKDSKPRMTFEGNLYNIKERMAFWDKIFK